jgi:uncharacterized repeat protein (TIGR01451 family)
MIVKNKWLKVNIMNKITSIMNISKSIFLATALWLSFAQTASANLVTNPFFTGTAATATGWTSSQVGAGSAFNHNITTTSGAARPAVPAAISAAGGTTEFYSGCVNAPCITFPFVVGTSSGAQQNITTIIGTAYTLRYWVYASSATTTGGTIQVAVYWGNTKISGNVPAGWSLQTVNLPAATATTTALTVLIQDNPDYSSITFMDVEPVVLQLAKSNPANLAVGVAANYSLTVSNISTTTSGASFTIQDQLPPNIAFNSAAAGTGITSVTGCTTSGVIATGLLVTCTANVTGGIAPSGTGTLTLNVTPQAGSAGVASVNKASVQYSGGVIGVPASASMSTIATPSTCTGTNTPSLGCAVAASITPTAAQLTFTKTVTTICDPFNGTSNPKNIPGAVVRWTMTVANNGSIPVNLATVSDLLSANTTFDSNLITGAGGAAGCQSASGVPENAIGKGFKLSIVGGTRPAASYPKFFTTAADADSASLSGSTVTINYALGLPLEGTYTAGQLNVGESVVVYFNVTIN